MISKVITFKDNNNNALLPISDARAVQITYANVTKSVHDAILDTEEAIATTYNNLTSRIDGIEYDLNNPAVLNTNNTASQTPMSNERIEGNIYLHKVAKTGSWNDLNNKPTIPAAPVKSNWNETNSSSLAYILNKPTIPAAPGALNTNNTSAQSVSSSESLSGNIKLHRISKTGNYNDLIDAPNTPVTLKSDEDVYASIDDEFSKENGAVFLSYVNDPLNVTDVDNFILSKVNHNQSPLLTYFSNISPDGTINIISIDESDNKEKFSLPLFYILDDTDSATLYNIIDGSNNATQASRNLLGEHVYNALDNNKTVKWKYNIGSNEYTLIFDFENNAENQHFEMFASRQGMLIKVEGIKSSSNWTITVTKTSFAVATQLKTVNSTSLIGTGDVAITKRVTATWNNNTSVYESAMNVDDIYTALYSQGCVVELHFINGDWNGTVLNCQGGYTDGTTRHMIFSGQGSGNLVEADVVGTAVTLNWCSLDDLYGELGGKQPTLVSGTNIKTVNNESLLGSGNIDADDVILGKLVEEAANPRVPSITTKRFYKFLGTYTSTGGQFPVYTPDYSSTAETGDVNKIYVDILTKKIYIYDSHAILNGGFKELSQTDLSNYYTKSEIDDSISNAKTTKFGYLDSSGDFYEAYWSTLTDTTTSYYLPAVDQNTLSYTNNLYIDINTGKNYRYKNGTLGTGETRFEEIKPCIAKEKIVRTDRRSFNASKGYGINMESKYFYIFGAPDTGGSYFTVTRLDIVSLINSYDDDKYENDFHGMVYCDDMVFIIPDGILIANDAMLPDMEWGYIFEFHILNNILTFTYTKYKA